MTAQHTDVVIIGAGPAGLGAAVYAAEAGLSVVVIEQAPRVGGMAATHVIDGVRVDAGSHRLHHAVDDDVVQMLRSELGDDLQVRPRNGRLCLAGQWVGFPLTAAGLLRALPTAFVARLGLDAIISEVRNRVARNESPTSYAQVLRRKLGVTAYEAMYAPYAEKLWGIPGEHIDPEQARVRVTADSLVKVGVRVVQTSIAKARSGMATARAHGSGQPASANTVRGATFYYPRKGFGQIAESLADRATRAGAQIRTGTQVHSITPGHPVRITTADGQMTTGRVLSTIPATTLSELIDAEVPPSVLQAASALDYRAMTLVYLTHSPDTPLGQEPVRWTPFDAHYFPDASTPVSRMSEPANYRDSPDDPRDRSVICAEIPCDVGDSIWESSDSQLAEVVRRAVADSGLPALHVSNVTVRRLRSVYPVYRRGYAAHLECVEDFVAELSGITTFGRSGLFAHDNTHHALAMAREVAACLGPGGALDEARWRRAREGFREHVVED